MLFYFDLENRNDSPRPNQMQREIIFPSSISKIAFPTFIRLNLKKSGGFLRQISDQIWNSCSDINQLYSSKKSTFCRTTNSVRTRSSTTMSRFFYFYFSIIKSLKMSTTFRAILSSFRQWPMHLSCVIDHPRGRLRVSIHQCNVTLNGCIWSVFHRKTGR